MSTARCDCEYDLSLGFLLGALAVVSVPFAMVAAIRYIPPVRRAFRNGVAAFVDARVAQARRELPPIPRMAVEGAALAIQGTLHTTAEQLVHEELSIRTADHVLSMVGAPTGP